MQRRLIVTSDGTHTIHVPEMNENYHSVHGAMQESEHIFINAGLRSLNSGNISVFEAGFGTGLNALLSAIYAEKQGVEIHYVTIEKFPLPDDITKSLNYGSILGERAIELFSLIHSSPWETPSEISRSFTLTKIRADLVTFDLAGSFDIIFFDAFGPDKQPEMWSGEIFRKIAEVTRPEGVFVTYSSKGEVKRNLRASGFSVKLLTGPPGKRHIIRAIKN
jgi:tRNA U34 5-methylaminomethyl-2-thiouridine-forming methyltransferase MnmC